jgi:transcriptional regulator with XRE-family HTH domain
MPSDLEIRTDRLGRYVSEGTWALWAALKKLGWNQRDLARKLGLKSSSLVNRWLHGDRRPGLKWIFAIEKATGVPASKWATAPRTERKLAKTGTDG